MKYRVIGYDVWGNARDGYWVNDCFYTPEIIEVDEDTPDMTINRRLGMRGIKWEGEYPYSLYGTFKRNGKPAMELRPIE